MTNELGEGIRAQRERKGLSLRAVASSVGISASMLSQVETGKLHPSVATLYQIASYLDVSVDALLGLNGASEHAAEHAAQGHETSLQVAVVRAGAGPQVRRANGVVWERLAAQPGWNVESILVTYEPGGPGASGRKMTRHNGVESGYLLEGELTLYLGFEQTTLRPGDSFSFDATGPHLFVNESSEQAKGVWFIAGGREPGGLTPTDTSRTDASRKDPLRVLRTGI
ncbi:XRE family transcriptional regulator [Arthrobacter sp. AG367]|uniref:helix-turn-helix domain-containing protein n=1 Tax=Arthrobacter sp. AG367 TaxID=2572909 RepID=UPI0011A30BB2|nr:XRE family transcriptional regulator [Arthrobacter sp. AG367]